MLAIDYMRTVDIPWYSINGCWKVVSKSNVEVVIAADTDNDHELRQPREYWWLVIHVSPVAQNTGI